MVMLRGRMGVDAAEDHMKPGHLWSARHVLLRSSFSIVSPQDADMEEP